MSKESKLAKKEAKAAKKAAKAEKSQASAYAKLVKKIDKKNAKLEKKANKKNKPFVPIAVPTQEEAFAAGNESKAKKVIEMIALILLLVYLIYFLVMFINYTAPEVTKGLTETTVSEEAGSPATYDRYSNPHKITTTPFYSVAEAKAYLKQVLHDNWKSLGYGADPSGGSINYTGNVVNVNNADCYVFTVGSRTYAVSTRLQSAYVLQNGKYNPLTFHNTDKLF